MLLTAFGIFLILHGWVHAVYIGQSEHRFALKPGMVWPDESWALAKRLPATRIGRLATIFLVMITVLYMAGGVGAILAQDWWRLAAVSASLLSAIMYGLFWDGTRVDMDAQGAIGVLIDAAIVAVAVLT